MNAINVNRLKKELEMFTKAPPSGISCAASNDSLDLFTAQIIGPPGSPYEDGIFELEIQIPQRYPFDPPRVRFVTPVYHPNIDESGRICLDTLKLPPKGSWRPCLNLSTVLMMIRVLMAEPGSEDPLMTEIWQEFKYDYTTYAQKARNWTKAHATSYHCTHRKESGFDGKTAAVSGTDVTTGSMEEKQDRSCVAHRADGRKEGRDCGDENDGKTSSSIRSAEEIRKTAKKHKPQSHEGGSLADISNKKGKFS
ncbi:ubiquitin-conjugating enzyme E2 T [Aplysia californica]|uniref:Ubiquitin-conjugating enzyme E2 T n=1 Tax=Aplysia californica TaxID=6500 RepID=A0ABM0K3R4_APLCA|nr:ubiquitin-conjugating enzyme E2 T [Aplysia californica]